MKRVINFVKGRRDDRRDKFVNSQICVEITNPAGQKVQSEDEHIIGLQSGYGYQVDINGKDKNMTKLHKAAWQGNVDKVKIHLKKADVNSVDHANRTALHFAVAQGHSNVASLLLAAKAQLDLRDSDGMTSFLKAVECGNKECVNMLLEQGADVNIVDRNGNTGLHLSSKLGFLNISSLLLMKGANINSSNNVGQLPLHLATEGEHRELVGLLLCCGAQVNVNDHDNRTPLMLAARFGHASLVSTFLEHGASLEACDSNGWTAEDYALIGGHQQLALDLKAPAKEQLCKEMEEAVVNGNSSDEIREEKSSDDCGKDVFSDDSEANQSEIVHETAVVQINSHPVDSNNGNNDFLDRTTQEDDNEGGITIEEKKEEAETVESPRSCITPPPLRPPRSWDLIQAGMIDEKEVQRRSLTTLGTLRSRRESFNENSNNNINNNGGSSPNQANDDLEKITDIVKTVQMEGLVDDDASSGGEENLPLDRSASVRRGKAAPLERTPSVDLTLTEEDLTKSKESKGCRASSDGGTLGREDTLQGCEEIWEKNANISEVVDNVAAENNNKLQHDVNDEIFDTGQLTTDISEQLVQRNREINTAVGYVTNEIYRIMIEKNESDGADKVVHTSSSLDNLDEKKQPRYIDMESSRSCDNLDNRYMTLEEKLCSGIYSAETLDTDPSVNENEGTQSLDNLDESPVGTVIKRNMHREVQSLDTLDDYDQCCSRGCVEARPTKKHARNKSVSVGQHGWSKSVDVLSKPSNIDRIQIDTKKIDAQLECYDEALRELAQAEIMKRNSSARSSVESKRSNASAALIKPSFPSPPPADIPYFSEVLSSSSQKSREYFMKPKDESDFSINQDFSPLPKVLDKCGSVDGYLDMDRMSTSVEITSIKSDFRLNQSNAADNDSSFNHDLPPPPPPEADLYLNLETLPGDLENENVVIKLKPDDDTDDSESKRAREVESNLYKLEKDLFNINMSAIMKPRTTDVNQNGIVHQDIVVANREMPPFDLRSKVFEKAVKQTSFAVFDEVRSGTVKQREDSLSPVDRSVGEDSPQVPPRYKRSLRKGKSESEVWKVSDGKPGKSRSKSASMYAEVEALFERPSKGRKKSAGGGEIQEKSESDSELCERPLRRKRKMLLAMRGVVAGSKDSEDDDDDTSTGDPPFWLSTDKGGHFARQDTVLATQPARVLEKSQDPPGSARASQPAEKPADLDKDWTSSDADTASGSDDVVIGNAFALGSHHKLLKQHLRQATNDKTALEETVALLREREDRLQYELADARQALSARQDTVHILQEQARRTDARYSVALDELHTLRHSLSAAQLEIRHLTDLCDKLAMEKAEALEEVSRLRDDSNAEQCGEKRRISSEAKPEQMQILQRQKQEAERRNEILVNHLEEAMRQCECARSEKDALTRQNITDIKKLQQDTLLWKERYEDCLGRLERIESECQPRLHEAQRTIEMLRSSIKQHEAEKELNQDNWKAKVMDEIVSRVKRNQNANNLLPKSSCDRGSSYLGSCMKAQGSRNKKCPCSQDNSKSCVCQAVSNSRKNSIPSKVDDKKFKCSKKFCYIHDAAQKDLDREYLSKLSLLLDQNRKLLENLFAAKKEKDCIRNELREIRRNLECDLQCRLDCKSPSGSLDKVSCDRGEESNNCSDLMKIERKFNCLSKVKSILSKEQVEVEGVLRSIQEVGEDLENNLNNLHTQIVLVKSLNQYGPESEILSQNSSNTTSSDGDSHPNINRCDMRCLVKELVDIKRDLLYLHSESERISKMLEFIFKKNRNGEIMTGEVKTTTACVQKCSKEILKLNSEILKLHMIIQTLMVEFSKNLCKCAGNYDANRNIPIKTEPGSDQNGNRSKQSEQYGQNCQKSYDDRNKDTTRKVDSDFKSEINGQQKQSLIKDSPCYNRRIVEDEDENESKKCKKRLDSKQDGFDNRKEQNSEGSNSNELDIESTPANEREKCGLINEKNRARFSITNEQSLRKSELKNSRKFHDYYPMENHDLSMDPNLLDTGAQISSSHDDFGDRLHSVELVVVDDEGVRKVPDDESSSILAQIVDHPSIPWRNTICEEENLLNNSNYDPAHKESETDYIRIDPQSSSQEIIYLKKALTNKSSKLSSELSEDRLATDCETIVDDNTTNSVAGYQSEPVFNSGDNEYPSSSDFDYSNCSKTITTESLSDGLKPCRNEPRSTDEPEELEKKKIVENSKEGVNDDDPLRKSTDPIKVTEQNMSTVDSRSVDRIKESITSLEPNIEDGKRQTGSQLKISNRLDYYVSSINDSSVTLSSTNILSVSTSNVKSICFSETMSNESDDSTSKSKMIKVDDIKHQFKKDSKGVVCSEVASNENKNNKSRDSKNSIIPSSKISISIQTNKSLSDLQESAKTASQMGELSRDYETEKSLEAVKQIERKSEIFIKNSVSNQSFSKKSCKLVRSKSKCAGMNETVLNDQSEEAESNNYCKSSGLNKRPVVVDAESIDQENELTRVDENLQQSDKDPERKIFSDIVKKENYYDYNDESNISVGVQTSKISSDSMECETLKDVSQSREKLIEKSQKSIKQCHDKSVGKSQESIRRDSETLIKNGGPDGTFSDETCRTKTSKSKDINQIVPDCYLDKSKANGYCGSGNTNAVNDSRPSTSSEGIKSTEIVPKGNDDSSNVQKSTTISVGVQTTERCAFPLVTEILQYCEGAIRKYRGDQSKSEISEVDNKPEILINNGNPDKNISGNDNKPVPEVPSTSGVLQSCEGEIQKSRVSIREVDNKSEILINNGNRDQNISGNDIKPVPEDPSTSGVLQSCEGEIQKSRVSIREVNKKSEVLINNGNRDQNISGNDIKPVPEDLSTSGVLQSCEGEIQKSRVSIREVDNKSEILINNGNRDQNISGNDIKPESEDLSTSGVLQSCEGEVQKSRLSITIIDGKNMSEKNCQTEFELEESRSYENCGGSRKVNDRVDLAEGLNDKCGSSKFNDRVDNIKKDKCNNDCYSKELNKVDDIMHQLKPDSEEIVSSDIVSEDSSGNNSDVQQSKDSISEQPKDINDFEETLLESGTTEGAVGTSKTTTRKIIKRTEYLNNRSVSVQNTHETTQTHACDSNSESRQSGLSVRICNCNVCECSTTQNTNKKSCLKHLSTCLKRQNNSPKNNDRQVNFVFENIKLDPSIFSGKEAFNKLLPVEKSLELFFRNNLTGSYSLDDFKSNMKLSDWRLNPFLERKMAKQLFDLSMSDSSVSSDNPLEEVSTMSHVQIYADLQRPILLPRINLSSITCKVDSSKDVGLITDLGQKLSAAQSTVDFTLQATASASNLLNQDDEAIQLEFQQVENLECPDTFETIKTSIVNDVNRTSNAFQDCDQPQQLAATSLSQRERQAMEVGRIRQQALLESENNLSAKIAEINSVLHQQLVEQDRRRAHNESQMKKEFELTRQKLLMELSKVQTALKAKEAEERLLREKYEKLSRDVEKTAEMKRKQLIEKSYSLNLAHPSTMWEKELSVKRNVVQQPPLPPPPPPPPLPPPDLPGSFSADDRFSHLSLRAQLHQSIAQHRTNPRNPPDQVNLAANCVSQFEDVASGTSGNSVTASTSASCAKR